MKIKYFASIRELTGKNEIEWQSKATTLGALLEELSAHHGARFAAKMLKGSELHPEVIILINGHDARHQGGAQAKVSAEDTISIFPMVAGGSGEDTVTSRWEQPIRQPVTRGDGIDT